jgi:hypothetical protein
MTNSTACDDQDSVHSDYRESDYIPNGLDAPLNDLTTSAIAIKTLSSPIAS